MHCWFQSSISKDCDVHHLSEHYRLRLRLRLWLWTWPWPWRSRSRSRFPRHQLRPHICLDPRLASSLPLFLYREL